MTNKCSNYFHGFSLPLKPWTTSDMVNLKLKFRRKQRSAGKKEIKKVTPSRKRKLKQQKR